jgi:hypothetical protein
LITDPVCRERRAGLYRGGPLKLHQLAGTTEIVTDPPGHARLPINDEEIIDQTLAIQALAGQRVTMITYDTGQSLVPEQRAFKL